MTDEYCRHALLAMLHAHNNMVVGRAVAACIVARLWYEVGRAVAASIVARLNNGSRSSRRRMHVHYCRGFCTT
jgi:hypothetical protein